MGHMAGMKSDPPPSWARGLLDFPGEPPAVLAACVHCLDLTPTPRNDSTSTAKGRAKCPSLALSSAPGAGSKLTGHCERPRPSDASAALARYGRAYNCNDRLLDATRAARFRRRVGLRG